jgi:hypothetical protein
VVTAKQTIIATTYTHATIEELLEVVVSVRSAPRLHSEHERGKLVDRVICSLPEPSDSKIWSRVPWASEPRIAVLARASSNFVVSQVSWLRLDSWGNDLNCEMVSSRQ